MKGELSREKTNIDSQNISDDLKNLSSMRLIDQNKINIFSSSKLPSYSSIDPCESVKRVFKKKKHEETTVGSEEIKHNLKENNSSIENLGSKSKQNIANKSFLESKITLGGVSNLNCSRVTDQVNFKKFVNDSQFPSVYQDSNNLSKIQIQEIIKSKMEMLDRYNKSITEKKSSTQSR